MKAGFEVFRAFEQDAAHESTLDDANQSNEDYGPFDDE